VTETSKSVVLDREREEEQKSGLLRPAPAHPVPALRLVAPQEDKWFCTCRIELNS
jgi:hypothetical protein